MPRSPHTALKSAQAERVQAACSSAQAAELALLASAVEAASE
jgi:hypothetical protein